MTPFSPRSHHRTRSMIICHLGSPPSLQRQLPRKTKGIRSIRASHRNWGRKIGKSGLFIRRGAWNWEIIEMTSISTNLISRRNGMDGFVNRSMNTDIHLALFPLRFHLELRYYYILLQDCIGRIINWTILTSNNCVIIDNERILS